MNIEKMLLNLAVRFETFYQKWISDDEPYQPWMDVQRWKETRPTRGVNNVKTI